MKELVIDAIERGKAKHRTYGALAEAAGLRTQHTLKRWRDGDISEDALKMLRVFEEAGLISSAPAGDVQMEILTAVLRLEAKLTGGLTVVAKPQVFSAKDVERILDESNSFEERRSDGQGDLRRVSGK